MPPPPRANRPMTPLEWAMLLALATVWGGSFFFNGIAVRELPVFTVVVSRVALAAILLLGLLRLRGEPLPRDRRVWAAFFGMGLLNNAIPFSLIAWGQTHIASGVASILNAATPLFTVILAHVLTSDERMTGGRLAGVAIGFAGVAVMIGHGRARRSRRASRGAAHVPRRARSPTPSPASTGAGSTPWASPRWPPRPARSSRRA